MCRIIAYVGAGGKTSSILETLADERYKGKRMVVTTTTRMKRPKKIPEGTDRLTESLSEALSGLDAGDVVWYGHPAEAGKIQGPSFEEWEALVQMTDFILVEADGSKRLPVKVPGMHEPVIFPYTDEICIVMGMSGLGKSLQAVCHRLPLVIKVLGKEMNDILEAEDYVRLLTDGYIELLRTKYPQCRQRIYLNQVNTEERRQAAETIKCRLEKAYPDLPVFLTDYRKALICESDKGVDDSVSEDCRSSFKSQTD